MKEGRHNEKKKYQTNILGNKFISGSHIFSNGSAAYVFISLRICQHFFWTVIFAATLIESLVNKSIFGSVFSVAFLLIVYAKPLRITRIVPWTILLAAFLIWIGLYLLFKRSWGPTIYVNNKKIKGNWSDLGNNKKFHAEHVFFLNPMAVLMMKILLLAKNSLMCHVIFVHKICEQ